MANGASVSSDCAQNETNLLSEVLEVGLGLGELFLVGDIDGADVGVGDDVGNNEVKSAGDVEEAAHEVIRQGRSRAVVGAVEAEHHDLLAHFVQAALGLDQVGGLVEAVE